MPRSQKTNGSTKESRYLGALSTLLFDRSGNDGQFSSSFTEALEFCSSLPDAELREVFDLADSHHVTVRVINILQDGATQTGRTGLAPRLDPILCMEQKRIANALHYMDAICRAFEAAGCPVTVIKSVDHWPDLGGDIDLYTSGSRELVIDVFRKVFKAKLEPQSWGDRLANKWNFRIPGLPELVECHVKWLGQTGEQVALARRVEQRQMLRQIGEYVVPVPAPEERIVISTLQRMYRHFYIRLCDIANIAALLRDQVVDFAELKKTADMGAIWPGVATLLTIVMEYVKRYGGTEIRLPQEVTSSARSSEKRTYISEKFVRIPIVPDAAELYTQQMVGIGASRNFRAMFRLGLLPALATAAFIGYKLTGSDKGIW
jgi:Uncharacterised nucleotidyltransferase